MTEVFRLEGSAGQLASMTAEGHQIVNAVCRAESLQAAMLFEEAYTLPFAKTPTAAGDYFFYLKNLAVAPLVIYGMEVTSTTTLETIVMYSSVTGSPAGVTTAVTAVNDYVGSVHTLATTDATVLESVDITGLTPGPAHRALTTVADVKYVADWSSHPVVLAQNQVVAFKAAAGGIALAGAVYCYVGLVNYQDGE
jgi:hypothetical protein